MDELARKLRADAEAIGVTVSPELDDRIRASLESATQEAAATETRRQPAWFWWASSLTGVAATLGIIVLVNLQQPVPDTGVTEPPPVPLAVTQFDWQLKPAVLTQSLEQELADIQADLKKAEQAVRSDIEDVL